jgi:hypothetical protein
VSEEGSPCEEPMKTSQTGDSVRWTGAISDLKARQQSREQLLVTLEDRIALHHKMESPGGQRLCQKKEKWVKGVSKGVKSKGGKRVESFFDQILRHTVGRIP